MTSIPVNNAKSLIMDFAAKAPEKVQNTGETGSFTDVLSKQTEESQVTSKTETTSQTETEPATKTQVNQNGRDRVKTDDVSETQGKEAEMAAEEAKEAIEEAGMAVVKEIAEELGVSEEAVLEAMEVLGLTAVDLMQPENLNLVVMQAAGETDPMALVTNAELGDALKNLNQFVQNLKNELQATFTISEEQLKGLIEQVQEESQNSVQTAAVAEASAQEEQPQIIVENLTEEGAGTQVEGTKNTTDNPAEQLNAKAQNTGVEVTVTETTGKEAGQQSAGQETGGQNAAVNQNVFAQNLNQTTTAQGTTAAEAIPFATQQTQEIMDQIMDYMKIQIKPEVTQLEMQLHPESLGNVNVHIASKEGIITAQFTAQNETVKAALETQIIQLKETFAEQGVKVEAIEVSVQANEFRQEYEGNRDQENTAEEDKKKSVRRINLSNTDLLTEETLSEEEQLAVSMMEANGNTVDYTA